MNTTGIDTSDDPIRQLMYRYSSLTYRCEDYDLWFRFYAEDFKGYVLDKKLYYFKEDSESYKRKKFKYRIDEMRIRWNGYKAMDVEVWNYIYVLKPLFVGLLPKFFIMKYHRRKYMLNDKNKQDYCKLEDIN